MFRISKLTCLPLAPLLLLGCNGEPTGTISGKVTYKGSPVTAGAISFNMPGKGVAQNAKLDSSGVFAMTDPLPAGTYQAYYVAPTPEPVDPAKGRAPIVVSVVPKKYQNLKTSGLSFEVQAGKNDIPIDLKD